MTCGSVQGRSPNTQEAGAGAAAAATASAFAAPLFLRRKALAAPRTLARTSRAAERTATVAFLAAAPAAAEARCDRGGRGWRRCGFEGVSRGARPRAGRARARVYRCERCLIIFCEYTRTHTRQVTILFCLLLVHLWLSLP